MKKNVIHIHPGHYPNLVKSLDFLAINTFTFLYVFFFGDVYHRVPVFLGGLFSFSFLFFGERLGVYKKQFTEPLIYKTLPLFKNIIISYIVVVIYFIISQYVSGRYEVYALEKIPTKLAICAIFVFIPVILPRLVLAWLLTKKNTPLQF